MEDLDVLLAQPETCASSPASQLTLHPNEHEERLWLRQQQFPSAPLARIMAFHLAGALEPARLEAAIALVLRDMPGLDVRYHFDDDGELRKVSAAPSTSAVIAHPVRSRAEALNALLAEQGRPWDLAAETQLRFRLFSLGRDEAVLGIVVHRILDGGLAWGPIFTNLARAYDGKAVINAPDALAAVASIAPQPDGIGLSWLRRPRRPDNPDLTDYSQDCWLEPGTRPHVGARYGSIFEPEAMLRWTNGRVSPRDLLATATVLFGRFLLPLQGGQDLKLTVIDGGAELGVPLTTLAPLRLRLPSDGSPEDAVQRLLAGGESCAGSPTGPGIEVTWLADDADILVLPGLVARRLPLPSLDTGAELSVGLTASVDGRLSVELATGPNVSPTIGAFLLERFAAFAHGEETTLPFATGFSAPSRPADRDYGDMAGIILDEFRLALDIPDMGADDDFFDLGGHSLIATRVIGRLLGIHGIEVQINDLFGGPTATSLARHARRRVDDRSFAPAPVRAVADQAPLSLAQQSLWKVYSAFGYGEIFNIPFALRFLDPVDESAFERAFLDLMERHPVLRSLFSDQDGTARQVVVPMAELGRYKWFWSSRESEGLIDRNREAGYRFDLTGELPLRLRFMIDEANGQQVLSLLFQHVVLDEWSVNLLMGELEQAYRQRLSGNVPHWKIQAPPFHEFAAKQRAAGLNTRHVAYWTERLRGVAMGTPLFPRVPAAQAAMPEITAMPSAAGGWVELTLESATVEGLYALAKSNGASLFNVVYAAIVASLHFLGAPDDLAIGTSASGRTDADFFDTVGYFTTVVCHRVRMQADITIAGLVRQIRDTVNESMPYSDIPIDLVEEALDFDAIAHGGHMFGVFIQLHAKNKLNGAFALADGRRVEFRQVDPDKSESLLGLHYEVMEETIDAERTIRVMMSYRADLYDMERVEAIRRTTCLLFSRFATADSNRPLASLRPAD